jgi:hypothetical protein
MIELPFKERFFSIAFFAVSWRGHGEEDQLA